MFIAKDKAGHVLALVIDPKVATGLLAAPEVSQVSRVADESFVADDEGFHPEGGPSRVARLRESLNGVGLAAARRSA